MKYVHEGVEYDVADLRLAVRESAKAELLDNHPHTARCLFAAAALLARHERVCEAAEGTLTRLKAIEWSGHHPDHGKVCPECWSMPGEGHVSLCSLAVDVARLSTALRGEEDHRG